MNRSELAQKLRAMRGEIDSILTMIDPDGSAGSAVAVSVPPPKPRITDAEVPGAQWPELLTIGSAVAAEPPQGPPAPGSLGSHAERYAQIESDIKRVPVGNFAGATKL